jgi:hypothetical protein
MKSVRVDRYDPIVRLGTPGVLAGLLGLLATATI